MTDAGPQPLPEGPLRRIRASRIVGHVDPRETLSSVAMRNYETRGRPAAVTRHERVQVGQTITGQLRVYHNPSAYTNTQVGPTHRSLYTDQRAQCR